MPPFNPNLLPTAGAGQNGKAAVVVLGHGSRAPEAGILLGWLADSLAERLDCPVALASLQFNRPTLAESCRKLADTGVSRIVVAPYFLFEGIHMKQDIPGELDSLREALPGVELVLAESLGADERLVEVIKHRINEASNGAHASEGDSAGQGLDRQEPVRGAQKLSTHPIEAQSFAIIDALLKPADAAAPEYQVARRVVHATGEPALAGELIFSEGAIAAATGALGAGAKIVCDVNMAAAGVKPTASSMGIKVYCGVAGEEAKVLTAKEGITRGAAGIRLAARITGCKQRASGLDGAVVVVGNAPTALFECLRLVKEEGARPAVIIGVPVGFVGAAESKEKLLESGVPHITLPGNGGGSSVAVAIVNALLRLAGKKDI